MARHQLKPVFDQVVIKELEPDRMRKSGLVVPPGTSETPPQQGIILAIGEGVDWWQAAGFELESQGAKVDKIDTENLAIIVQPNRVRNPNKCAKVTFIVQEDTKSPKVAPYVSRLRNVASGTRSSGRPMSTSVHPEVTATQRRSLSAERAF